MGYAAMAPLVPLQTLICETVPEERLGEANGVIGSAKSMTSLVAYVVTAGISEIMRSNGWNGFQWAFFAASSCISSAMLLFAFRVRVSPEAATKQTGAISQDNSSDSTSNSSIP